MARKPLGVGIVGLQPGRSWAAIAHVPALRSLPDDYEIVGVANSSPASAKQAAQACDIPYAFADVAELVASPAVQIVTVTVKVPHHFELVKAAIDAGKHVYCEWPLGNGLQEAQALADMARARGVLAVVGTQARAAPEIEYLTGLIAGGYVGEVLSSTLVGSGRILGPHVNRVGAYILDVRNGANMLTIPLGHTLAAMRDVLGDVVELSASLIHRRTSATVAETQEVVPMTSHDQVLVNGTLHSGAPVSIHYRGGLSRGTNLLWEINGTEGDIQVSGPSGHTQMVQLSLKGARGEASSVEPIEVPPSFYEGWPKEPSPRNVARVYARMAADLRDGTTSAPTFDDALAVHQIIAAIESSAGSGLRVPVLLPGRPASDT
ncbi:Gfo/Idh/MocA family protein [Paraburkholderia fungorum]